MTISKFRPGSSSWFRPCSTQYWVGRIFDTFRRRDLSHLKMTMADERWKKSRLVFDEVFSNESDMFAESSVKLVRFLFVQEAKVLSWCRTMPTRASTCTIDLTSTGEHRRLPKRRRKLFYSKHRSRSPHRQRCRQCRCYECRQSLTNRVRPPWFELPKHPMHWGSGRQRNREMNSDRGSFSPMGNAVRKVQPHTQRHCGRFPQKRWRTRRKMSGEMS